MRNVLLTAALAIAASPALALAPSGGEPNNTGCNGVGNSNSPCQPSNTNENTNGQSQAQGQGQAQGQIATGGNGTGVGVGLGGEGGRGGNSAASGGSATSGALSGSVSESASGIADSGNSTASGGSVGDTSSASGASSDNSGGNSTTHVDASNNSRYTAQSLFLPSIQAAAPTFAPGALATVVHGQCGPLMAIQSEEVTGTYLGLFRKHSIPLAALIASCPTKGVSTSAATIRMAAFVCSVTVPCALPQSSPSRAAGRSELAVVRRVVAMANSVSVVDRPCSAW